MREGCMALKLPPSDSALVGLMPSPELATLAAGFNTAGSVCSFAGNSVK